jgi:hypothetical protein
MTFEAGASLARHVPLHHPPRDRRHRCGGHRAVGRLIAVDPAQSAVAGQTAAGAGTVSTLAGLPFKPLAPVRATVASDGSVWITSTLPTQHSRQSRLVRYDTASGKFTGQVLLRGKTVAWAWGRASSLASPTSSSPRAGARERRCAVRPPPTAASSCA